MEIEDIPHYLLRCHFFSVHRKTLFDSLDIIDGSLRKLNDNQLVKILLHGSSLLSFKANASLIEATITYLVSSGRFQKIVLVYRITATEELRSGNLIK